MKLLIADKFEPAALEALEELGCSVEFRPELTPETLPDALRSFEPSVLIVRSTRVPEPVVAAGDSLELIIRAGAGFDTIDTAAAGARGVRVATCPGMNATAVAELTIGFLIALDRRLVQQTEDLRRGGWAKTSWGKLGRGLKGRTLGLIGVGQIGRLVARRAIALEMDVLYHDLVPCPELDAVPNAQRVERDHLLRQSDFVSLHVPLVAETRHLINAETLALMKEDACLINTTRGPVVDQRALVDALRNGRIAGAALDVYEDEPAAEDESFHSEILELPNFIGTHHVGASTQQSQRAVGVEAVRVVKVFVETGEVVNCVNADAVTAAAS